jgi:hypothetical protein
MKKINLHKLFTKTNWRVLKSFILASMLILLGSIRVDAQIKVGNNPTVIDPNSALEIESTNKGLLLPRLGLTSTTATAPLAAHIAGMTVYNTATTGDVTPGFYYNDGTKWVRLFSTSTALNTTAANNLVTITNGIGATMTAMTVGIDTTQLKSFLVGKVVSSVTAPLSGTGTAASPLAITTGDLSVGTLLTTTGSPTAALLKTAGYNVDTAALKTFISNAITNGFITGKNTTAGLLTTIANGAGATLTAMTVGVDTTALKSFVSASIAKNTSAGSLVTVTNGTGAALVNNTVAVDTTALKSFLTGKVSSSISAPITGDGTVANPISVTRATATSGVLTTVTNGTNAAFTALKYDVDTTALKTFISSSVGKNTTAGSLVTVTNGTGAALVNNTVEVDTTALKSFLNNKVTVTTSAPLTGNGTTANPLSITRASATSGVLTTVTNGANATFTPLQYDVDTVALKAFIKRNRGTSVITTTSSSISIPDSSDVVIYTGTGPATFTLPLASTSYGRELRILNYASSATNIPITLTSNVIVEGNTTNETETVINSKDSSSDFPLGIASRNVNTVTLISNGTAWYKLGN